MMGLHKVSAADAARLIKRGDDMARKASREVQPGVRDTYLLMAYKLYALATGH